jgi:hypothetical protein
MAPAIRPRKPSFAFADVPRHWLHGSVVATQFANGLNLLFPAGERFFVRSVHHYLDRIDDPELRAQVRGFSGQEGRHAQVHEQFFATMRAQGYRIDAFLAAYQRHAFERQEKLIGPLLNLASTAAAEHFTAILAANALAARPFDEVHPAMRDLLLWHAAEEIEHKTVAFDVLKQVNPSYAVRIGGLALATMNLAGFWLAASIMLLRQEGLSPRQIVADLRRLRASGKTAPSPARVMARGILAYLRPSFHPADDDNWHLAAAYVAERGLERAAGGEAAAPAA